MKEKIPENLKDFFNNNYPVFVGRSNAPKELSSLGDGFKGERLISSDDINNLSRETLLYIAKFKNPDFVLRSFKSGSINFYQV